MPFEFCRACGCTDTDCRQCIERTGAPCSWVEDGLCSACLGREVPVKVECRFKDATGNNQVLTFEIDLTMGIQEQAQLETMCNTALEDKNWKDYKIESIRYGVTQRL